MISRKNAISTLLTGLVGAALITPSTWALDAPKDRVVLMVSGQVSTPNHGKDAVFSMDMLEKLPQHSFVTKTPWFAAPVEFTGPKLKDVLAVAGASGSRVTAYALNDYRTEIPFSDVEQEDVIVARLMNGKPMTVREKGPLFIVYPFDSRIELRSELYYNRSAWQLSRLVVQ
jgi:hypothetical protein